MRYYLDSEFIDTGSTIELISIGIVCEDGREYYAQIVDVNLTKANQWVKENVFPHLHKCKACDDLPLHTMSGDCTWRTRRDIAQEIKIFFNPSNGVKLYGWCSGYDFVAFCQLFGTMMDLPQGYPHYIRDLQQVLDEHSISDDELPQQEEGLHNALADAKHIKRLWQIYGLHLPPYVG